MRICARIALVIVVCAVSLHSLMAADVPVKNRYIVGLKADQTSSLYTTAYDLAARFEGKVHRIFEDFNSFEIEVDDAKAPMMKDLPYVEYVQQQYLIDVAAMAGVPDAEARAQSNSTPAPAPGGSLKDREIRTDYASACPTRQTSTPAADGKLGWGLDRIDQRSGLDETYRYGRNIGQNIDIYVIGSGIHQTHEDFNNPNRITDSHSVVNDGRGIEDCDSWGTKLASLAAGKWAGIAKGANIIPVKMWGCNASPNNSDWTAAYAWIRRRPRPRPAIVLDGLWTQRDDASIKAAARDTAAAGFFVVVATGHGNSFTTPTSGNSRDSSPGNATGVFTVASSRKDDKNSPLTYMGREIDIFAPGEAVVTAGRNYDREYNGSPGSSGPPYAAGYVAGAAAVATQWLKQVNGNPNYMPTNAEISAAILNSATRNALTFDTPISNHGTVNALLYTRDWEEGVPQVCTEPPEGPTCDVEAIEPRGGYFSPNGGTIRVDVTADKSCAWSAVVNNAARSWLRVRSCAGSDFGTVISSGSGALCVELDTNYEPSDPSRPELGSANRHGTITINNKVFTVNQAGMKPPVCPVDDDGDPTFEIVGPSSVQNGQNIVLTAFPGEGFTYSWHSTQNGPISANGPQIFLRPNSGLYPNGGSVTFRVTVRSARCPDGITVSKTVSVHGDAPSCALTVKMGPDPLVAATSPGARVTIGVYGHPFIFQPEPQYQWYRGASGDESNPMDGEITDTIRPFAREGDMYWVKMTNSCGVQLSGTAIIVTASPPKQRSCCRGLSKQGSTDVLFRNPSTGANLLKAYNGPYEVWSGALPTFDAAYQAQAVTDLNADQRGDIIWRNPTTGENKYWRMFGTSVISTNQLESHAPAWQIGASADYDDDGYMDLIWQNKETNDLQMWFMNEDTHFGTFGLGRLPSGDWKVQGTGDFNFDEKPDVMFRNYRTGANVIWEMNDTVPPEFDDTTQSARNVGTQSADDEPKPQALSDGMPGTLIESLAPNWRVASVADIDNDGRPDIIWIDPANGQMMYWRMYGTQKQHSVALPPQTDPSFEVAGVPPVDLPPAPAATTMSLTATPASFGETTTLTATLSSPSGALAGKSVVFNIAGSSAGIAFTGIDGTAIVVSALEGLSGGSHTVTATFGGDANFAATSATATLQISAPQVQLSWAPPAPIVYGTALSDAQLSATADVAGTFVYTPAAGTVLPAGDHTLSVTFTPADQATYAVTTTTVPLTVTKAVPSIHWPAPLSIAFGTALSSTQLNASSTVPGSFDYNPPAGTILHAGNGQRLLVTFTPSDANYETATAETLIDVTKAAQTISWAAPAPIVYGTALSGTQLNATVSPAGALTYSPAAGTILGAGSHTLTATAAETADYQSATATVTLQVTKANSTVQWSQPASIVYGTALSATQLNATASVPGSFSYTPAAGSVLNAGTHTLQVSFTPSDAANYNSASASVQLTVTKATPSIAWSNPAAIVYGTPLGSAQLNATSPVSGSFTYSPAAGTVLNAGNGQTLSVQFTSSDANYTGNSASVTINVLKAKPVITWPAPAAIVYGTALSATQLNATANVGGSFTYSPAAGTILNAGSGQTLSVQFTPSDASNYESASASTTIDVAKAKQNIAWSAPSAIVYGTALSSTQLNATVSVVGPSPAGALSYAPAAGTVLQAGAAQTLTVTAAATANYDAATASVTIDVLKAKPVVSWSQPASIIYGTLLGNAQLNATANVPGSFAYTPAAGTKLEAGTHTLSALFTPADTRNYETASGSVSLTVQRATPVITWADPASIVYGTALSATQLNATADVPGSFAYTPDAGTILNAGAAQTLSVQFTPSDTHNYNNASASVKIDVAKARQTLAWANPAAIVYGTALSSAQLNATVQVVGPAAAGALVYTPSAGKVLDAGNGHTLTVTAQATQNYESATLSVTIDVNRAPLSLVVDAKSKLYGAPLPALTGTLTGVVNGDPITPSYSTTGSQQSVVGTYPISGSLNDPANRLVNYNVTITSSTLTVHPAPLQIVADSLTKQYSDPLPLFTATYLGLVLGDTPASLSGALSFATSVTPTTAPGTYPLSVSGVASPNYAIQFISGTITVTAEDARAYYTGTRAAMPLNSKATTVDLTLSATVKDISATTDAAGDTASGDIRNATATFVDRATGATLCTAPIALISASDTTAGSLTCTATVPVANLNVGIVIGKYYTRNAAADDTAITINLFTNASAQGTGKLALTRPAGAIGTAGGEASFHLNASTPSNGNDDAGNPRFSLDLKNGSQRYRITSSALRNLAVDKVTNSGSVEGVAVIEDLTGNKRVVLDAGALVRITFTDSDGPTANGPGTIAITVSNRNGGFWFVSNFDGTRAVEQSFTNGEVKVR